MRRMVLIVAALVVGVIATPAQAERGQFQVRCFSDRFASVDPIVAPGGMSFHEHEFFGNLSTNKDSTYESMIAAGTNCSTPDDTAAYWAPTLLRADGSRVRAESLLVYYRGDKAGANVQPFPKDLRMISHDFRFGANNNDRLRVIFPSCTDGRIDSWDHMSHMAFPRSGDCPASHPVRVPAIVEIFRYGVPDVSGFHLSSGDFSTGHADFWNTWEQSRLIDLTATCLNAARKCGRIDG